MAKQNYYLLAALPGLGELGSVVPLSATELLGQVGDAASARTLLEALFLSDDLLQHQGFGAGELEELDLVVLTAGQGQDAEALPDYIVLGNEQDSRQQVMLDHIWQGYYGYVSGLAKASGSTFLADWVGYEVALRNGVAEARAKALGLDATEYLVRPDLADPYESFGSLLNEWASASNPLAGLRVLDEARWDWLGRHDGWFTFKDDELVAYGAKLMLLRRWQRLSAEPTAVTA
jgi:hypothetical protein